MLAQNDAPSDPSGGVLCSWFGSWDSHCASLAANAPVSNFSIAGRLGLNSALRTSPTNEKNQG